MRKVTFGGASSLDNFIAREDGSVDWLIWSSDASAITGEFWPRIDTMLMGRKTYEAAVANSPSKTGEGDLYPGIKTYVFSTSIEPGERSGVTFIDSDPGKFVKDLKTHDGKEICVMGGGELARTLFDAGVIDEIGFNIHPVLLGSGIPLFHKMQRQIDLELLECRPLESGCVYVLYRIKG